MEIDPLSAIAMRYGGDKFGSHMYTPHYHRMFGDLRGRPIKLLEMGIGGYGDPNAGGSSLLMWSEYFPAGSIVGLDVERKNISVPTNVTIYQGSQADAEILRTLSNSHGPFDIVIDDASHRNDLTQQSFLHLYPMIAKDGTYVIEDTQTAFSPGSGGSVSGDQTMFAVAHALGLFMHRGRVFSSFKDDYLIASSFLRSSL